VVLASTSDGNKDECGYDEAVLALSSDGSEDEDEDDDTIVRSSELPLATHRASTPG
jgi:hypothetical protein